MIFLRSKRIDPFRGIFWGALIGLMMACGSAKVVDELSYPERKAFENFYFEACKQKVLGNQQRAISLFHLALKEFPNSHASMYELGLLYYLNEELVKAEEWSLKAMALNPEYNHWYALQLASIYTGMGKYASAGEVYAQMIAHEPKEQELYIQASAQYVNANQVSKALAFLDQLEANCGVSEESATRKEFLLIRIGRKEEAVKAIERLVAAYPNELHYRGYLAETLLDAGERERAMEELEELLRLDSSYGRGHQMLHDLYREEGEIFKAYTHLLGAFRSGDIPIGDKLQLFTPYFLQMETNNLSKNMVVELSDILLQEYPMEDIPYIVKGDVYTQLDSLERARELYQQATTRPTDHQTWNKLISIDGRLGRTDLQIADADLAIARFPNIPGFYLAKGVALYDSRRYRESVNACQDGLDIALDREDQVQLHACLGLAYGALDQVEASHEHYEEALRLDPSNALIMNNYAYALAIKGRRLDVALAWIDAALEQDPVNPYYLDTKAWVLYRSGKGEAALPLLERALLLDPEGLIYLEHLAEIHHALGHTQKAAEYLERAQSLGSTFELP